jgi:uncharacterized protein YlzI (FlbEa/FlbD family)
MSQQPKNDNWFPSSKVELHQWFNTLILGTLCFLAGQTYLRIDNGLNKVTDKIYEHETRITVLEKDSRKQKETGEITHIEAILPDATITAKNEE